LVECQLPKLDVAGSNPVLRSIILPLLPRRASARVQGARAESSEQGRLIRSHLEIGYVGEIPERLPVVEAIADEEVIGHLEAAVANLDVHETLIGPVKEGADLK
jgi:hypothetical protein